MTPAKRAAKFIIGLFGPSWLEVIGAFCFVVFIPVMICVYLYDCMKEWLEEDRPLMVIMKRKFYEHFTFLLTEEKHEDNK